MEKMIRSGGLPRAFPSSDWWQSWCDIVSEMGKRYGNGLAGWWIDDGMTGYYPWRAPFRKMWRALKHGNRDRVVGYNQYYFPPPTRLQDFIAGELSIVDVPALRLSLDAKLRVQGSNAGWPPLHATYSTTLEHGDWTFMRGGAVDPRTGTVQGADLNFSLNYSFPSLMYETSDLLAHVLHARDRNVWPIFNVLISQEGVVNPVAIEQLAHVAAGLASSRRGITVPAPPSVAQLPSSLARTGPALEGPIFWRQNTHLVGWEHANAFAAWLLDAHACERGLRVTFSSPCHAASLRELSVSVYPQDHCQISFFDDDINGSCGGNQSSDSDERLLGGGVALHQKAVCNCVMIIANAIFLVSSTLMPLRGFHGTKQFQYTVTNKSTTTRMKSGLFGC